MQDEKNSGEQRKGVKPIPEGMHTITPFVILKDADKFAAFVKDAFDGELTYAFRGENNEIVHGTVRIGDSTIMIAETMKDFPATFSMFQLYVEDVDSRYNQALKAGGESLREPKDEFYGDRSSGIKDPWGNQWWIATHIEDVSDDEVKRRHEELQQEKV
jgi:uncharacterized glyoxalase superfamily protein PhnB